MTLPHFAAGRRPVLEKSVLAVCYFCFEWFNPSEIKEWTDFTDVYPEGVTAICPHCGVDSVAGDASGLDLSTKGLTALHRRSFGEPS